MNFVNRVQVLGVGINTVNLGLASERLIDSAQRPGLAGYVTVTGVHGVMESQKDEGLKKIHNDSYMSVPDGMPMVWVGKAYGNEGMGRVYGPDLMLSIMERSCDTGQKHFLFGGGDGVAGKLEANLKEKFDGVTIVGRNTPPFRPLTSEEDDALFNELQMARPHFFWVGLSTPKQEKFMAAFLKKYQNLTDGWDHGLIMLGVGAAFDFHAGLVPQAPSFLQKCGLEWLFRLTKEPKRLWRRYLYNNPRFIWGILRQFSRSGRAA